MPRCSALPARLSVDDAACSLLGGQLHAPLPTFAAIAIAICSPVRTHAGARPAPVGQCGRQNACRRGSQSLPVPALNPWCAACRFASDLGRAARARRRSAAAAWPPTASWPATSAPPALPQLQRRPWLPRPMRTRRRMTWQGSSLSQLPPSGRCPAPGVGTAAAMGGGPG